MTTERALLDQCSRRCSRLILIHTHIDKVRYSKEIDKVTGFETCSIICSSITNRQDKIIGVIEVLNKRNVERFTVDDEKTMKVIALMLI